MNPKETRAAMTMKIWGILRPPLQTLDINFGPTPSPFRGPLTQTPKNRPGKVLSLPQRCGACGSYLIGYDALNVVTCDSCDALLSVSGQWHRHHGQIQPLTEADMMRARRFGAP